jgi:5-methyltetrahydrofolate--homocysteine methyltransferase
MKPLTYTRAQALPAIMKERIVVLDGAMGTMIQRYKLLEADYRGERFKDHPSDLKGNNELLQFTRPDVISEIHEQYLAAGADIIETNTFGATSVAQEDYGLAHLASEMNSAAARLARQACDKYSTTERPRFVAGAMGPTTKSASIATDVNDPAARGISFDELKSAFYAQGRALLDSGVDIFLLETLLDTLNAKAAIFALEELMEETGERLPVIVSGTMAEASNRIVSGQTIGAFWHSVRHARPLAIGLNCAMGAALMRPGLEELSKMAGDTFISCYPNAGPPNPMSETGYDEPPEVTARFIEDFAVAGFLNLVGGCCGTTPAHIAEIANCVSHYRPRPLSA